MLGARGRALPGRTGGLADSPFMRRAKWVGALAGLVGIAVACTSAGGRAPSGPALFAAASRTDAAGTVWLCRPGLAADPCTGNLDATAIASNGERSTVPARAASHSAFDCFYVYPTVSPERGPNSDLRVQAPEIDAARAQAERFSQVCDVWAPMYRQVTLSSLLSGGLPALDTAYDSLLSTWNDYLRNFNHGRPVIFIGHSQGAAMLIRLLANQVDPNAALRARTVVAILLGGNVQVAIGQVVNGSFRHLPLCTSPTQRSCVIAYSSFPSEPPPGAFFGRPGEGVSLMSLQLPTAGQQVACVNPAALGGGTGALQPYYYSSSTTAGSTPWVTYPGLYSAACRSSGGATWLQVDHVVTAGDTRPVVSEVLGRLWGYHVDDVQLALGNLAADVRAEEAAYGR
jgi:hypothetical protein